MVYKSCQDPNYITAKPSYDNGQEMAVFKKSILKVLIHQAVVEVMFRVPLKRFSRGRFLYTEGCLQIYSGYKVQVVTYKGPR